MVLMPPLEEQVFLKRPSGLSGDSFLRWIWDKYFGDEGGARNVGSEGFHSVHHTLNSMINDPLLSIATARTTELVDERTPQMISFSTNLAK
jgi:hypothetical protein